MLEFRSDAPLPEVPHPFHQIPSAHRPFVDSHPDLVEFDNMSGDDSDGGATLAEDVEGRKGGVDPLAHEGSPAPEAGTSCPKRPRTTVRKRRVGDDAK